MLLSSRANERKERKYSSGVAEAVPSLQSGLGAEIKGVVRKRRKGESALFLGLQASSFRRGVHARILAFNFAIRGTSTQRRQQRNYC